jgi:hypothetical protein
MDEGRHPDRLWFWQILATVAPALAKRYHEQVQGSKHSKERPEKKVINVSEAWLAKLSAHEFESRTPHGRASIMIQQAVKPYRQREAKKRSKDVKIYLDRESLDVIDSKPDHGQIPDDVSVVSLDTKRKAEWQRKESKKRSLNQHL